MCKFISVYIYVYLCIYIHFRGCYIILARYFLIFQDQEKNLGHPEPGKNLKPPATETSIINIMALS